MFSPEVKVSQECNVSDEEVVAILLWELTFFGFTPQQMEEFLFKDKHHAQDNPYVAPFKALRQRYHDLNCRYAEDIGTEYYSFKKDNDMLWEPKRNGPKRHRERRQQKRIDYLEKMVKRWDLCHKLLSISTLEAKPAQMLGDEILNCKSVTHYPMCSLSRDGGDKIQYLIELFKDYFCLRFDDDQYGKATIMCYGPGSIMARPELKQLLDVIASSDKLPAIGKILCSTNDQLDDLYIDILVIQ